MALDADRRWLPRAFWGPALTVADRAVRTLGITAFVARVTELWRTTRLYRFFSATLARRIFVANLLGLVVLVVGIFWLSQHQAWLITAKRDGLRVQGEIIAAAIAASASLETDRITFDPERLPEVEGARLPYRDDGFAALELSLRPDKVGPVLRRLIQSTHNTRARIYGREGELIVDTARPLTKPSSNLGHETEEQERIRVKTWWTRVIAWFDGSDLPVYREIGSASGTYYSEVRQALRGNAPLPMLLLNERGQQIVSLAVPIQRRNATLGAVLLSTRPGEIDDILATERLIIGSLALMALLATLMASMMLDRTIAAPVRRLSAAAEHVSQSITASTDLPDYANRRDEVGQMADAFRRMTAALYRRIEASEKFAADVAHELKNPLAAARSTADALSYARTPDQQDQLVQQIQAELKRLNRLITDVSNASRLDAELARQTNEPVDLAQVLATVVDALQGLHTDADKSIVLDLRSVDSVSDVLIVKGHEGRLGQVITNLVDNAVSFAPEGGKVEVIARRLGSEIEISIEDDGPGILDDKLEKIFERFYSDRPQSDRTRGKNSGLGLSISREIVEAHGGRIWAENKRSTAGGTVCGARFVVRLPSSSMPTTYRAQASSGWRP